MNCREQIEKGYEIYLEVVKWRAFVLMTMIVGLHSKMYFSVFDMKGPVLNYYIVHSRKALKLEN
jgi:hypothetical protein